ncbi:MAG: hypothetical protein ABW133_23760 [Polyangiaceae bacterium]
MTAPVGSRSEFDRNRSYDSEADLTCREESAVSCASDGAEVSLSETSTSAPQEGIRSFQPQGDVDGFDIGGEMFAIKGRDPENGVELEIFSAAGRTSVLQDEGNVAMARVGRSSDDGRYAVRAEVMTAKVYSGTQNADGTTGLNVGFGFTTAGVEATVAICDSLTGSIGVSGGVSLGGSIGVGDTDHDGKPELCVRGAAGIWAGGICAEKFW